MGLPPCDGLTLSAPSPWHPAATGTLRSTPEDFRVDEVLSFEPDGQGEHAFLQVRKRGLNTDAVARQLARLAGVRPGAVSYAGLKDRHALTTQWFSVHLPGRADPDWTALQGPGLTVQAVTRNRRKLRRGALAGNRFDLVVRALRGDRQALDQALSEAARRGVPNYFGPQRFGRGGSNLTRARVLFGAGRLERQQRAMALSAARAYLFNRVLALRVARGDWNRLLPGEWAMLNGTHSVFAVPDPADPDLLRRLAEGDLHPTGPLWGRGEPPVQAEAGAVERTALAGCGEWRSGLEAAGLTQERRALRVLPAALEWSHLPDAAVGLRFVLPAGSYATAVLAAVMTLEDNILSGAAD
jgi:tRNA pseudouridine13 synthase